MTIAEQLHKSAAHHAGFEPNCPKCVKDEGIDGIIDHLTKCAVQNTLDSGSATEDGRQAIAVAAEQRRMLGILKLYRMHCCGGAAPMQRVEVRK